MTASASRESGDDASAGLEEALSAESRRLEKLWDAYKAQESELQDALKRVRALESDLEGREDALKVAEENARANAEQKDAEIARLNAEVASLEEQVKDVERLREEVEAVEMYKSRVQELEAAHEKERERLAKLYLVYEELEDEVKRLREKAGDADADASATE